MGVERLDDSAVILRVTLRTLPQERWTVAREFRRRLLRTFRTENIEMPFPHLTIYLGAGQTPAPGSPLTASTAPPAAAAASSPSSPSPPA